MSSILRALRKLEEQRAEGKEDGSGLARDILRIAPRSRSESRWIVTAAAAAVVLLLGGSALVWQYSGGFGGERSPSASEVSLSPPARAAEGGMPEPTSAAPEIHLQATGDERPREAPPAASFHVAVEAPAPEPLSGAFQELPARVPLFTEEIVDDEPNAETAVKPDLPDLRLTGIVYQADPNARMAIIDDLPVMAGTMIEEATVEEILPDRVRLSREGTPFELFLEP